MSVVNAARALSLAWTGSVGYTSPLSCLQGWKFSPFANFQELLSCIKRVPGHYKSTEGADLTVETTDMAFWAALNLGERVTNLTLTVEAAIDAGGSVASGATSVVIVLTDAIVFAKGEIGHSNADSAPLVASVTFRLSTPQGGSDASWSVS